MRQTTADVRHDEAKATSFMRTEAGPHRFRCPRHPSRLGIFANGPPKPRQWRSPVPQSEQKLFPKCELSHTSRPVPERCCSRMGRRSSGECWFEQQLGPVWERGTSLLRKAMQSSSGVDGTNLRTAYSVRILPTRSQVLRCSAGTDRSMQKLRGVNRTQPIANDPKIGFRLHPK